MSDGAGKYRRLLSAAVENISNAFYDAYVEVNCRVRAMAGLKMTVIRDEVGDCCDWCADLAGIYNYETVPKEVWERHEHCRCIVTTRTEKGTYQDAWNRKEFNSYRENRIAREKEILEDQTQYEEELKAKSFSIGVGEDVTDEYIKNSRPYRGRIDFEEGFVKEENTNEISIGEWLYHTFGGELLHINEHDKPDGKSQPDYLWRGRLWDLKTVSTEKAANSALQSGIDQTKSNMGGIILNYGDHVIDNKKLSEVIKRRMGWHPNRHPDVIIIEGEKFTVIRF